MLETELKFQIPPTARRLVAHAVAGGRARRTRLQAVYVDTADRRLAAAGLALRLRREGAVWVQTLKGRGDGLAARLEDEHRLGPGAEPALQAQRHAASAVGQRLLALLADGTPLGAVYRTDILRTHRLLRRGDARLEVAHDRGFITAAGRALAVDELEIELLRGSPQALQLEAQRWVQRFGLWWDVRTKSERGHRLAHRQDRLPARDGPSALERALLNGAELAEGLGDAAHVAAWAQALSALGGEAAAWAAAPQAAAAARDRALTRVLLGLAFAR
jgi:triphosphatase